MAEILKDENPRKDLYRMLLADKTPGVADKIKKYSFNQFEKHLLSNEDAQNELGWYLEKKGVVSDPTDFSQRYIQEPVAPPAPKPQAAPVAPAPVKEEPYVPEPQPLVGSPEYDAQLEAQYQGMTPTLGATFGGVPAAFETKAQKKQEQISPAFKAQQLAFEDVPIAEEQRRAQRQFAKATKERQQAALMGGPGFEVEQKKRKKERGYGEWGEDVVGSWVEGGKRIGKNILSTVGYFAQTQAATDPMANLPYEKRQEMMQQASQTMYDNAAAAQNTFQNEIAKRNIQTSVLQAINKGDYSRLPESVLYTVGDAAMQIIPSILTFGGSTYAQTLPQVYKDGVDAIAKEKGISPEQAIANGDDAFVVSQINAGVQSALEYAGAGLVSKGIASKGGYKAMRDWLLSQNVNRRLAQGAALLGVGTGEAATEYGQELTGQIGKTAAKSPTTKAFLDKLPNEIFTPEARNQRAEAFVGGFVGGLGLTGGGQAIQSAMDRTLFESPKIGKATQRADYDVVQTDNKITERNKIVQAMEEAVKANPEAAGQIRQQYQKLINEAAPKDEEVLSAYESLSVFPETEEKNAIRENLEAYMAEKGIAPESEVVSAEEVQGTGRRVFANSLEEVPAEYRDRVVEVTTGPLSRFGVGKKQYSYVIPAETIEVASETAAPITEEVPSEEVVVPLAEEEDLLAAYRATPQEEDEDLAAFGRELEAIEQAAPVAPAEEEVVTEEVPAEPVAPEVADIESRRQDTESKIKRKDLFSDGGVFANTLGGSGVDSVPTQHREINGIEFVEFSNPNTGVVDVVMTGTSDRDFVGFYRLYENGKPTNKWSSKFENQSRNKENFKTMLSGVQEMLPEGHEYTEKTSISTDGLRVWNQQLSKGYELQYDENGNLVTNRVAINGDAIVNELGIPVEAGDFNNIRVSNKKDFETVKKALLPYLEKFGLGEKNMYMTNGTVEIDLPVLRKTAPEVALAPQAEEVVSAAPVEEAAPEAPAAPAPKGRKRAAPVTPAPAAPKEGDAVQIAPQREGGSPRKMVFKDGEWRQNVGGDMVKVGPAVQQQAQEAFAGKAEAKPAETKEGKKAEAKEETRIEQSKSRAKDSKDAQNHSADLSGEAYELEDGTGLIQGFNLMGKPVYSGYKKGKRTRVDIDSYTGDVFTAEELSALKELKRELEASEKASQTQDPFKQQGRVAKTDSVPENVRKFVEDITKSLGIDKKIIIITDGDFNEGQYQKHGLYGTLAQVRSAKQSASNPYEYGSKRYMSDADAFYIYYDGKLKGDQLFTVVSHEIGHIVEQEVFNNSSEQTKKSVKEDYEKWLASLTGKTVEEVARETRDITLADLIEGNTRKFDSSKDRYISSFSEYFADNVAKWARTSAKPKSAVDKYFSGIVEAFKKLYDYVSEKGLYSKSLFEWLDGMYKAPAEAQFTSEQSSEAATAFDKAKTSKGFDKKYGKGAYKALSDITKNFEDIMDKVSEKIKQDCIV